MGILDEAIREHLELKRQHGAGDSELRDLEDEAFGPPARPGEAAPTDAAPGLEIEAPTELAALQEAPEPAEPAAAEAEIEEADAAPFGLPDIEEAPPAPSEEGTVAIETEEHPPPEPAEGAVPPEPAVTEPAPPITERPTELYDAGEGADVEDAPAASEAEDEPVEDEFFSEQSLSDELDQALDAPEGEEPLPEPVEPDGEEHELAPEPDRSAEATEATEDGEDVLEETPEFLQDTPEHDRLWFEQRPPKDFDFDD
jgi:hypothetical protein